MPNCQDWQQCLLVNDGGNIDGGSISISIRAEMDDTSKCRELFALSAIAAIAVPGRVHCNLAYLSGLL
ncbi:hypothetical protein TYRP_007219 [Tyrophagus putrescentiae]|nr:hypothetical protein TYRP_007219 [Tyrophagus putrescentiae]